METITTRVNTDKPVVLVELGEYLALKNAVEDDFIEQLYKMFGVMYTVSNSYSHTASNTNFKEDFDTYLKKDFPYLKITTRGNIHDKNVRLYVQYDRKAMGLAEDGQ